MAGRFQRTPHLLCLLAVTAAVVYLYRDLLDRHAFLSHEQFYEYLRAQQTAKEFVSWHVPQVFPDALNGAGYAFPRFYPPFSVWLSAGLGLLVGDTCLGVNLTFFLSALASGAAMYAAVCVVVRDWRLALASSMVYVSLPYRFVDIYARGALAESWTFAWYPLIVMGMWRAARRRELPWYLPLAVAGLLLTHNITGLYVLAFCAIFTVVIWLCAGARAALPPALGVAGGLGLAVWFLLPQQYYLGSVWVSDPQFMWADISHVHAHRVLPLQLFYSLPKWWWGESRSPDLTDGMSFELGAAQLLIVPLVLLFLRARRDGNGRRGGHLVLFGWVVLGAWLASVAFVLCPGAFLWALPRQFAYIQFPWRMLAAAAFFGSFGIAIFARIARVSPIARGILLAACLASVVIVPSFEVQKWSEPDWIDENVVSADALGESGGLGYTVLGEYLPRDFDVQAYRDGEIDGSWFEAPRISDGDGEIVSWSRDGLDIRAEIASGSGCVVVFPLVYYDFYRAADAGGRRLETFSSEGFLAVRAPGGVDAVAVTRGLTPISILGLVASAVATVVLVWCAVVIGHRRRPPRGAPDAGSHATCGAARDDAERSVVTGA